MTVPLLTSVQDFAVATHGRVTAASGAMDWLLLALAVLSVGTAFGLCLRFFLWPGEEDPAHIKREVLRDTASR